MTPFQPSSMGGAGQKQPSAFLTTTPMAQNLVCALDYCFFEPCSGLWARSARRCRCHTGFAWSHMVLTARTQVARSRAAQAPMRLCSYTTDWQRAHPAMGQDWFGV